MYALYVGVIFRQIIAIYEIRLLATYKFTMHYTTAPFSGMSIVVIYMYDLILLKMSFTIVVFYLLLVFHQLYHITFSSV